MHKFLFFLLMLDILILSSCGISQEVISLEITPKTTLQEEKSMILEKTKNNLKTRTLGNPDEPSFQEIAINSIHNYNKKTALAFLGGTFIDIDSDGKNEFIITGGDKQNDAIFQYQNNKIVNITQQTGLQNTLPSYGAYSIDFNEDGQDDLFITRQDGIYYYENTNGKLVETKLNITFPKNAVPLDIDFADIDNDNDLDMYVSTFITPSLFRSAVFNDANHVQKNILLQNDGDLNFSDITESSGLNVLANTFTSSFVDLDNDGDADIIISPNTDTVKIYENIDGKFTLAYEGNIYAFWMGLALSDVDNDGDIDIFVSNVGTSIPEKFLQGDSHVEQNVKSQYLFLENTGNMSFIEKKDPSFDNLGFGWGIVTTDFNLDGRSDFLVMQNYIKWAPHKLSKLPGELLIQTDTGFDTSIKDYKIQNKAYGISALIGDINGDNFDDIIYLNLAGKAKVFLRNIDTKNNFLKINIPNTAKYLHANIEIKNGETSLAQQTFLPKQGLMTKQDSSIIFGLNTNTHIPDTLIIHYLNGKSEEIELTGEYLINL